MPYQQAGTILALIHQCLLCTLAAGEGCLGSVLQDRKPLDG